MTDVFLFLVLAALIILGWLLRPCGLVALVPVLVLAVLAVGGKAVSNRLTWAVLEGTDAVQHLVSGDLDRLLSEDLLLPPGTDLEEARRQLASLSLAGRGGDIIGHNSRSRLGFPGLTAWVRVGVSTAEGEAEVTLFMREIRAGWRVVPRAGTYFAPLAAPP